MENRGRMNSLSRTQYQRDRWKDFFSAQATLIEVKYLTTERNQNIFFGLLPEAGSMEG